MKYLADIVKLRGVEISVFPVYRAPRDAVGQKPFNNFKEIGFAPLVLNKMFYRIFLL